MSGKIQAAILAAALVAGGTGLQRAAEAVASNSQVLVLRAQYRMFTGDTDRAVQLLRQAAASQSGVQSSSHSQRVSCPYSKS